MGGGGTSLARHDLLSRNQYAAYSREASEAHSEICCIVCILTGGQPFRSGLSRTMNHLLGDRAQTGRSGRSLNLLDRVRTNGNGRFRSLVRDIHHGLCIRCCKKGLQWRLFFFEETSTEQRTVRNPDAPGTRSLHTWRDG